MNYATLYDVKQQLGLTATTDDALLQKWIARSTALVDWWKGRRYDIVKDTKRFDVPNNSRSFGDVAFGETTQSESLFHPTRNSIQLPDLLSAIEVLNGDGEEILSTEYLLKPYNETPKSHILLKNGVYWVPDDDGNYENAISVEGYWGFHSNYSNCFVGSGDTVLNAAGLLASSLDTSIQVADVNGIANDLISPRFSAGHVIRLSSVNGIEFCHIITATAVVGSNDILSVVRGYNGTSPLVHPVGTVIELFRPEDRIVQTVIRLVQWRYRQKDANTFDKIFDAGAQQTIIPSALPADVERILGTRKFVL